MPQAQQRQDAHEVRYAGRPGTGFVTDAKLVLPLLLLFSHHCNTYEANEVLLNTIQPRREQCSDPLEVTEFVKRVQVQ